MILSDNQILKEIKRKNILIKPFNHECLGSNSYDVHLGNYLATYNEQILDAKKQNKLTLIKIPKQGFILRPNELYLASTKEYTETFNLVPFLEGRSSVGRLGIDIHATAGKGDAGFCNYWTLEMSVKRPVRIYAEMPIGQIIYFKLKGKIINSYNQKISAKYNGDKPLPIPSMLFKDFKSQNKK